MGLEPETTIEVDEPLSRNPKPLQPRPLSGRQVAWIAVMADATAEMQRALIARRGNIFGILVYDDVPALIYQIAHHRFYRARYALTKAPLVSMLVHSPDTGWSYIKGPPCRWGFETHIRGLRTARKTLREQGWNTVRSAAHVPCYPE